MPRETQNKRKRVKNKAKNTQHEVEPAISLNMLRFQDTSGENEAKKEEKSKKKSEHSTEKEHQGIEITEQDKIEGNYQLVRLKINDHTFVAVIDTGVTQTTISKEITEFLNLETREKSGAIEEQCNDTVKIRAKVTDHAGIQHWLSMNMKISNKPSKFHITIGTDCLYNKRKTSIHSNLWIINGKNTIYIPLISQKKATEGQKENHDWRSSNENPTLEAVNLNNVQTKMHHPKSFEALTIENDLIKKTVEAEIEHNARLNTPEMNSMKFAKPRKYEPNNFESKYKFDLEDRIHILSDRVDKHIHFDEEEDEFFEKAAQFVTAHGTTKLLKRNDKQIEKKKENNKKYANQGIKTEVESNNIELTSGTFRMIEVGIKNQCYYALVDTGASHSVINESIVFQQNIKYEPTKMKLSTANHENDTNNVTGKIEVPIIMKDERNKDKVFTVKLLMMKNTNRFSVILGADVLFNKSKSSISEKTWTVNQWPWKQIRLPLLAESEIDDRTNKWKPQQEWERGPKDGVQLNLTEQTPTIEDDVRYEEEFEKFTEAPVIKKNVTFITDTFNENEKKLHMQHRKALLPDNFAENEIANKTSTTTRTDKAYITEKFSLQDIKIDHIPTHYRSKLISLCKKYEDIFSKSNFDIGCANFEHKIEVTQVPKSQKKRFIPPEKAKFLQQACDKLLEAEVIEECDYPLAVANIVMVEKFSEYKDATKANKLTKNTDQVKGYRLAQDFRDLNQVTLNVKRTEAINLDQFISKISKKVLSQLDITQAYFTISLHKDSQPLTCFYGPKRIYMWKKLGQGLISSGAVFNDLMKTTFSRDVLREIKTIEHLQKKFEESNYQDFEEFLSNYVDDIFSYTDSYEEGLFVLEIIFIALRKANLKLSPKKCLFLTRKISILGYILNSDKTELLLDEQKANSILNWPRPNSLFELQSRMFALSYFSKFLYKLKEIVYPLLHMLRTKQFKWTEIEERAWLGLKDLLRMDLRLAVPKQSEKLYLFTDASQISCAQVLFVERDNRLKVVSCNSQLFNYLDARKSVYLREGISLVKGIEKFKPYFQSSTETAMIFTDCKSLVFAGRSKDYNLASAHISNYLARFCMEMKFELFHVTGEMNFLADLFSRSFPQSRFTPKLSREEALEKPIIPANFQTSSDRLYQFLCAPMKGNEKAKVNKLTQTPVPPSKNFLQMAKKQPELFFIEKIRTEKEQKAKCSKELTDQISRKEVTAQQNQAKKRADELLYITMMDIQPSQQPQTTDQDKIVSKNTENYSIETENVPSETTNEKVEQQLDAATQGSSFKHDFPQPTKGNINDNIQTVTAQIFKHNQDISMQNNEEYLDNIKALQESDNFCNKVIANWPAPEEKTLSACYPYKIVNGILYRKEKRLKIVVPSKLLQPLATHTHLSLHHPSKILLLQNLTIHFFHPQMQKAAQQTIDECYICNVIRPSVPNTKKSSHIRSHTPLKPRQMWSADLITDLPKTENGYTAYLLMHDSCSKYTCSYLLKNKSAGEVTTALLNHITNFGIPQMWYTDADVALTGPLIQLQNYFSFNVKTSTPHSQNQNTIENSYRTLKQMITRNIYSDTETSTRTKWPIALSYAITSYNQIPMKKLNFSKDEMMFRTPIDNTYFTPTSSDQYDKQIAEEVKDYIVERESQAGQKQEAIKQGEIIFAKYDQTAPQGTNNAYRQSHRGPLQVVKSIPHKNLCIAQCLQTKMYFHIHSSRVLKIRKAHQILPIVDKKFINIVTNEIKRSSKDYEEKTSTLDKNLNKIIENADEQTFTKPLQDAENQPIAKRTRKNMQNH